MHLIAGLGNPGSKYARNRHNVGFMVVDALADRWGAPAFSTKFKGEMAKVAVGVEDVILFKPQTYMNLSGQPVQSVVRFFQLPIDALLCVHDELDLPWRTVRLKKGGGSGGHNGLRSIVMECGSEDFNRCRVGIGRPSEDRVTGYVLSDFDRSELAELGDVIESAAQSVQTSIEHGVLEAMNRHHRRS